MALKRPRATADAILDAALEVARERGWPAVTIRAVADARALAAGKPTRRSGRQEMLESLVNEFTL